MNSRCAISSVWLCVYTAGCLDNGVAPTMNRPTLSNVAAFANPHNGLSTVVSFEAHRADSARVISSAIGASADTTPYYPLNDTLGTIAVLGLMPNTRYTHVLQAVGKAGTVFSDTVRMTTADLPPE